MRNQRITKVITVQLEGVSNVYSKIPIHHVEVEAYFEKP